MTGRLDSKCDFISEGQVESRGQKAMQNGKFGSPNPPVSRGNAKLATLLSVMAALQGCTTSLKSVADPGAGADVPGFGYRLPYRSVTAVVDLRLTKCKTNLDSGLTEIEFAADVKLEESLVEGERIVIDYQQIAKPFKTGNLKATFWAIGEGAAARQSALLKSINVETKGEEVAAISAAISAFGNIASMAAKIAFPVGADTKSDKKDLVDPTIACEKQIDLDLRRFEEAQTRLQEITGKLEDLTRRVASLSLIIVNGEVPAPIAEELAKLKVDAQKIESQRVEQTKAILAFEPLLTFTQTYKLDDFLIDPDDPLQARIGLEFDAERFKKFIKKHVTIDVSKCDLDFVASSCNEQAAINRIVQPVKLVAVFRSLGPGGIPVNVTPIRRDSVGYQGIVYRTPVPVSVAIFKEGEFKGKPIAKLFTNMPQLGPIGRLPLRNRFGEHNILAANFAQDGALVDFEFKAQAASGVEALKAAQSATEGLKSNFDVWQSAKAARQAAKESSEIDGIKKQVDLLKAQKDLVDLQTIPSAEASARDAELESLRHRLAVAELEAKIKTLKDQ
jgi:hypothetical protein